MNDSIKYLNVDQIDYDTNNPRIKKALEKFGTNLDPQRIFFALRTARNGNQSSSYESLRDSIQASNGIVVPIVVAQQQSGFVCIDGNTRLAIYKHFLKEGVRGNWSVIKASILENPSQKDIEVIRVAAHLVGAREWPPYEKARYLYELRNNDFLEYAEIIALCGGNKTEIERQISAYEDMNAFYKDKVDDVAFQIDRFSGFVELQKPRIKESIFAARFDLTDFGEWIRDGKIFKLADVRQLPRVLKDGQARKIFLEERPRSIEDAIKYLDHNKLSSEAEKKVLLRNASIFQLANVLAERIKDLPYSRFQEYQNRSDEIAINELDALDNLCIQLQSLLNNVSE